MPAVTVLPLGSTAVTSTYSDIASAPSKATAEIPDTKSPPSSSATKEGQPEENTDASDPTMESSGGAPGHDGPNSSSEKNNGNGATENKVADAEKSRAAGKDGGSTTGTTSPSQSSTSYPQAAPSHGTPQQAGYYVAYNNTSQMTPEPPSPHAGGATAVYDVGSFFQQPQAGFHNSPFATVPHSYGGAGQQPNSPNSQSMAGIPPASPLFPRVTNPSTAALLSASRADSHGNPALSPGPPYVSSGGMTEDFPGWGDSRTIQSPYPPSPQISAQGIPIPYVPGMPLPRAASDRSTSFDESMLPPSADNGGVGQANGVAGVPVPGTLFAHQQTWGYAPPADMYGASSPLQPRPTVPYPGQLGGPPQYHHSRHPHPPHMSPYGGQYYPATSPGPPIQTTASNKGPDGANLFIFHIPNHFTNLDMYQLFCPYGNLLSVRIMVEKDSGRSRGFGFVSYDSPDSAALAIKELNGYAIGNKRLKVQHKQIRPSDQQHDRNLGQGGYDGGFGNRHDGQYGGRNMNLPPSGPMAMSAGWYNNRSGTPNSNGPSNVPQDPNNPGAINHSLVAGDDPAAASAASPANATSNPSGPGDGQQGPDPLSSMEPLRQTLPEVGGTATSAAAGENYET